MKMKHSSSTHHPTLFFHLPSSQPIPANTPRIPSFSYTHSSPLSHAHQTFQLMLFTMNYSPSPLLSPSPSNGDALHRRPPPPPVYRSLPEQQVGFGDPGVPEGVSHLARDLPHRRDGCGGIRLALRGNDAVLNFPGFARSRDVPASNTPADIRAAAVAKGIEARAAPAEEEFVDEEALFDLPRLLESMAEGMLMSPPRLRNPECDVNSPENMLYIDNLWS